MAFWTVNILVILLLLFSNKAESYDRGLDEEVFISAVSALSDMWGKVEFAYKPLRPNIAISLKFALGNDVSQMVQETTQITSMPFESVVALNEKRVHTFPLMLIPLALVVNLPIKKNIVLDTDTIAAIYLGNITNWLHPNIVAYNPWLPSQINSTNITIVMNEVSGINSKLANFLNDVSPEFRKVVPSIDSLSWPAQLYLNHYLFVKATGSFLTSAAWLTTPGALSILSYSYATSLNILGSHSFVFINYNNKTYQPNVDDVEALAVYLENTGNFTLPLSGDFWPLNSLFYLGVNLQPTKNCSTVKEAYLFLRWFLNTPIIRAALLSDLYVLFSQNFLRENYEFLTTLSCRNNLILQETIIEDPKGGGEIFFFIVAMIILILIWTGQIYLFKQDTVTSVAKLYQALLMAGSTISFFSLIFWFIEPFGTWICQLRIWLLCLGVAILLGTVFSRSLQLKKIQKMVDEGKVKKSFNHNLIISLSMMIVVTVQLVYLIIWSTVDIYRADTVLFDELLYKSNRICTSNDTALWFGLQAIFFGILLLWGIFVVYTTWNIHSTVDDSRLLVMSIYTSIVAVGVSVAIIGYALQTDRQYYWWAEIFVIVIAVSLTGSIYLPKILEITSSKQSQTSSRQHHVVRNIKQQELETRTGTKSLKNTVEE